MRRAGTPITTAITAPVRPAATSVTKKSACRCKANSLVTNVRLPEVLVTLGWIDDDVLLGGIGIAGDDGAGLDLAVNGAVLFIAYALAAAGMELVEVDLLAGAGGGVGLDRYGHQAESQ